jgi:phosphate transport system substrate-binding protein
MTEVITTSSIEEQSPPNPRPHARATRPAGLVAMGLILAAAAAVALTAPRWMRGPAANAAGPATAAGATISLNGAGATFPQPFYARLFEEYARVRPNVRIYYAGVGSGEGIAQMSGAAVDFGASDAPMSDEQLAGARGGEILHVPMTVGGVVPIYNLPGVEGESLVFSGPVLADIFRGAITRWNDPAIAKLNPSATLPDLDITVVHRADSSGTTYVFTEYLCKVSPAFRASAGCGATVTWPATDRLAAEGNESVAGVVRTTPGTIGYVELIFAMRNRVSYGAVINRSGRAVHATLKSLTAAAAGDGELPADLRMSIIDAGGADAYPIAAFTYLLVPRRPTNAVKAQELAALLKWAVTDGQGFAPALQYAPLPARVVERDLQLIETVGTKSQVASVR